MLPIKQFWHNGDESKKSENIISIFVIVIFGCGIILLAVFDTSSYRANMIRSNSTPKVTNHSFNISIVNKGGYSINTKNQDDYLSLILECQKNQDSNQKTKIPFINGNSCNFLKHEDILINDKENDDNLMSTNLSTK